jgi:hypothetical protein
MKSITIPALAVLILYGCVNRETAPDTEPAEKPKKDKQESVVISPFDKTIVPGTRVGDIHPASSETDLKSIYGKDKVLGRQLDEGEGNFINGTVIHPGTKDEVEIFWKDGNARKNPYLIRILKEGSGWHLENKISIGTSLETLVQLNKRPFYITGCCYDAPFSIISWDNGELAKLAENGVVIRLKPVNEPVELKKRIIGDKRYLVSDTTIMNSRMQVAAIFIRFNS